MEFLLLFSNVTQEVVLLEENYLVVEVADLFQIEEAWLFIYVVSDLNIFQEYLALLCHYLETIIKETFKFDVLILIQGDLELWSVDRLQQIDTVYQLLDRYGLILFIFVRANNLAIQRVDHHHFLNEFVKEVLFAEVLLECHDQLLRLKLSLIFEQKSMRLL